MKPDDYVTELQTGERELPEEIEAGDVTLFQEYLSDVCFTENPTVLDDDMPDFFDNWLSNLDRNDVLDYAGRFSFEKLSSNTDKAHAIATKFMSEVGM
jgi:hypothetical protein